MGLTAAGWAGAACWAFGLGCVVDGALGLGIAAGAVGAVGIAVGLAGAAGAQPCEAEIDEWEARWEPECPAHGDDPCHTASPRCPRPRRRLGDGDV